MKIKYTSAPLPGEHNNGEIWCHWKIIGNDGRTLLSGWRPTKVQAERVAGRHLKQYAAGQPELTPFNNARRKKRDPVVMAQEHWSDNAPDWVLALAEACRHETQANLARRLGVTQMAVSNVLYRRHKYHRSTPIEQAVRAKLMAEVAA